MNIEFENGKLRYFDDNGVEITDGCYVKINGNVEKIHIAVTGQLGTDATNPYWLKTGRAYECEWGVYPLEEQSIDECIVVKK